MSRQRRSGRGRDGTVLWPKMRVPGLTVLRVGGIGCIVRGHSLVTIRSIAPRAARRGIRVPRHGGIASGMVVVLLMMLLRGRRSGTSLQHRNRASLLRDCLDQCSHDVFFFLSFDDFYLLFPPPRILTGLDGWTRVLGTIQGMTNLDRRTGTAQRNRHETGTIGGIKGLGLDECQQTAVNEAVNCPIFSTPLASLSRKRRERKKKKKIRSYQGVVPKRIDATGGNETQDAVGQKSRRKMQVQERTRDDGRTRR